VPGDESIVADLAPSRPLTEDEAAGLLADARTFYVVAFEGEGPVGFVLAHELPRRHGDRTQLFVYEIEVVESKQRRGVGTALMRELERLARARGIRTGFVLTNQANKGAMEFYRSLGGTRPNSDDVMWDFEIADS
jgi:ribosomal protein S18 acetylase RimI-like enzyme